MRNTLHFFFSLFALMSFPFAVNASEIPIEDFFRHPQFKSVKLSPSAKYLAVVVPVNDTEKLVILDRETMQPKTQFEFGENRSVGFYAWINNERIVVSPNRKVGSLDRPVGTGDLFAGNADGSQKIQLLGPDMKGENQSYGFSVNRIYNDNRKEMLITKGTSSRFRATYRLDTYTAQLSRVANSPLRSGRLLFDNNDVARVALGETEDGASTVMYRNNKDEDWKMVAQFDLGEGSFTPIKLAKDGVHFWALSSQDAATEGLYYVNGETFKRTLVYRHPFVDIESLIESDDESEVIGAEITPDYPDSIYFSSNSAEARRYVALKSAFRGNTVVVASASTDKHWLLLYVHSDRDPGAYFLFDAINNKVTPLLRSMPWLKPEQLVAREAISVTARDETVMRGYLTLPHNKEKDLPLIIIPHGGPHGVRDNWEFDREAQLFANRGYAVVQINYRGSGGYGRDFLSKGFRQWGTTMQDDLTDAVKWAIKEGIANKDRVCIYGASYGGYSALMSPIREPGLYQCAVGYVGVYSIPRMFNTGDISERSEGLAFLKRVHGEDEMAQRAQSPTYNLDKLKTPIFIVHGEKDERAHFSHFVELREELDKRKMSYDYLTKPKEAHGFYDEANNKELYERMLAFFDKHIGH